MLPCKKCKHAEVIRMVGYGEFTPFGEVRVPHCMLEVEEEDNCGNFEELKSKPGAARSGIDIKKEPVRCLKTKGLTSFCCDCENCQKDVEWPKTKEPA